MKRYLVFHYDSYYPVGASDDVMGDYDTLDEARAAIKKDRSDHHDILDMENREWIHE